jgi:hypothetical protein
MRANALPALVFRATVALTVLLLPVTAAGPVAAGGPTSVLLSAPGLGKTASLYTGDTRYVALSEYVGAFSTPGAGTEGSGGPGDHAVGDHVSLTWLIHDVTVWRVDRIYVDAPGGPWIASQVSMGESIWDAPVTWHRATQPKALVQLLGSLGLVTGTSPARPGVSTTPDSAAQPQVATDRSAEALTERDAVTSRESSPTGSRGTISVLAAGLMGLAAGVMLTSLVLVVVRRRSRARSWGSDDTMDLDADVLTSQPPPAVVR